MQYMQAPNGSVFATTNPEWHSECTKLTQSAGRIARREYCCAELRDLLRPGATVYTLLRSVSSSGMSRRISVLIVSDSAIRNIDHLTADAIGARVSDKGGIVRTGCGMDMGFDLVYSLGAALWPNGTDKPHSTRNGTPDTHGGYALRHSWI